MMDFLRDKRVYIESYGCTFNHADAQKLLCQAALQGCRQVGDPETAEVIIINTCTVVESTERTMLRRLAQYSDRDLIVTGCMPVVQKDRILSVCSPHIILPEEIAGMSDRVGALLSPAVGIVQVARGCNGSCSYCITRHARGPLRSFSESQICSEIERLSCEGAREIQLTAQDVSSYGHDRGTNLAELLGAIADIPGDFTVRVGMMNPASVLPILDELIRSFDNDALFRFIHVPVQSGSDRILDAMKRGYHVDDFVTIIESFRRHIPGIRVSTDFIAGFPTESEEDFAASVNLLRLVRPTKVNITRYSARPCTESAGLHDIPDWIKKERSRTLTRTANMIYDEVNAGFIGRILPVLVTERKVEGSVIARDRFYTNIVLRDEVPLGSRCIARIVSHNRHYLVATQVTG